MFEVIHSMYNPERDAGPVTWVDMQLVRAVERLQDKIIDLEQRLAATEENSGANISQAEFIAMQADARR